MPTYEYLCTACEHRFEDFESMSARPQVKCPKCKKRTLRRLFGTGAGIIFKGSGFYETDYKKKSGSPSKSESESKSESKPESKSESRSDSKSDAKSDSKSESKSESKTESKPDSKPDTRPAKKDAKKKG